MIKVISPDCSMILIAAVVNKVFQILFIAALLAFVFSSQQSFGQSNQFGLTVGITDIILINNQASSKEFRNIGFSPRLHYYFEGTNSRTYAEAAVYFNKLTTFESGDNSYFKEQHERLRFARLWRMPWKTLNRLEIFSGASAATHLQLSEFHYSRTESFFNLYQWAHTLDFAFQMEYGRTIAGGKEIITASLYFPVISNISRTPGGRLVAPGANNTDVNVFGETSFLRTNNIPWQLTVFYQLPVTSRLHLQVSYELYHQESHENVSLYLHMNTLRIGMAASF